MSDNCVYVEDDGDPFDFFEENFRHSRKPWLCCECGDPIPVGTFYQHVHGLYDGEWSDYRTCARCVLVADDFFHGRIFTQMVEYFQEEHGFDYRDGIPAGFTPCGK